MIPQLEAHYELLVRWNKKINLTTIVDRVEAEQRHYGEGLLLAAQIPASVATVLDVGSGAGFPGAVIAAARPELRVTLLEGDQRKAAFLKEATRGWPNVKVEARRSTALRPEERWDLIVSRAVRIEDLLPLIPRHAGALMILAGEAEAAAVAERTDLASTTLVLPGSDRRLLISAHPPA